jgi:malate dehydrogenase (oxaloacetate-decarboxylating)
MAATPSAQYSLTLRVEIDDLPGMLGRVASAIGQAGATIGAIDLIAIESGHTIREITVQTADAADWPALRAAVDAVAGARVLEVTDLTFQLHDGGKLQVVPKTPLKTRAELSMAYTPGVARVCQAIAADRDLALRYTIKRNTVAVISDGTAVLGLGDLGPYAAMPVMEGKAMLFKEFANIDAFPICLDVRGVDEIVATVRAIAPGFGGINLEDIAAPRCFEIEERLVSLLDIPVFHDDQHGTAVVVLAALYNALALTGKRIESLPIVIVGLGAAGVAVTRMLLAAGARQLICCDSRGALHTQRSDYLDGSMHPSKRAIAEATNRERRSGGPAEVIEGAELLIGVSGARVLPAAALAKMGPDPIVFAMANPDPEVAPEEAARYARIVATGRSDYPNQINNVLCFPGLFRGALDAGATRITEAMKMAAARAIAAIVEPGQLREDYIVPSVFNREVARAVAATVAEQAAVAEQAVAFAERGAAAQRGAVGREGDAGHKGAAGGAQGASTRGATTGP